MPKLPIEVRPHIHSDYNVTLAKVAAFVGEPSELQLRVKSELRRRIADDSSTIQFTAAGLLVALFGLVIAPANPIHFEKMPFISSLVFGLILGFAGVVILAPFLVGVIARHERKARATVWLAAFEDGVKVDAPAKQRWWHWDRAR